MFFYPFKLFCRWFFCLVWFCLETGELPCNFFSTPLPATRVKKIRQKPPRPYTARGIIHSAAGSETHWGAHILNHHPVFWFSLRQIMRWMIMVLTMMMMTMLMMWMLMLVWDYLWILHKTFAFFQRLASPRRFGMELINKKREACLKTNVLWSEI